MRTGSESTLAFVLIFAIAALRDPLCFLRAVQRRAGCALEALPQARKGFAHSALPLWLELGLPGTAAEHRHLPARPAGPEGGVRCQEIAETPLAMSMDAIAR